MLGNGFQTPGKSYHFLVGKNSGYEDVNSTLTLPEVVRLSHRG